MSVVRRCPVRPVHYIEVSLVRILYETIPFLEKVSAGKEVSVIKDVRYREVSLYLWHVQAFYMFQSSVRI